MPQFNPDPQPLQQWLTHQPRGLRALFERARLLAEINHALRQWSDDPWLSHIRLANIRGNTLVIFSSSAAALVPLRHRQKALLDFLNQRFYLACTQLEAKVRPHTSPLDGGV